jgi:hypothetical protein
MADIDLDLDLWFKLGHYISRKNHIVIAIGYTISILLTCLIFTHGSIEQNIAKLWVKEGGGLYKELEFVESNTVSAGKDVVLIDASLVSPAGDSAGEYDDIATAEYLLAFGKFIQSTLLPITTTVFDELGVEYPITSQDVFETTSGTYLRMSPIDCYVEGSYDYFGESMDSCDVGKTTFEDLVEDVNINGYNYCHYARIWPFMQMLINNSTAPPTTQFSPQDYGLCRGFLSEDTLQEEQYKDLQTINDYTAFMLYDTMKSNIDLTEAFGLKIQGDGNNVAEEELEECSIIGNSVGSTTSECCVYLNTVAVVGIMGGQETGDFSNDLTCKSQSCYAVCDFALTMAGNMLGQDYRSSWDANCEALYGDDYPPSAPPDSSSEEDEEWNPWYTSTDPMSACLLIGQPVGETTSECCSYFSDVVVPGMMTGLTADKFANVMTCTETTCEASARNSLTLASVMLGQDYVTPFDTGCAPFYIEPEPEPEVVPSMACVLDNGLDLGVISKKCCNVFQMSNHTYNFNPGNDDFGFTNYHNSHACTCLIEVEKILTHHYTNGDNSDNSTQLISKSFHNVVQECSWHTMKTPSTGIYGCNRDSNSHLLDGCKNPFFHVGYYQYDYCDVTYEEFKDDRNAFEKKCKDRWDYYVRHAFENNSNNNTSHLKHNSDFHYLALNVTNFVMKSSVSENFWRPIDVDFNLNALTPHDIKYLPLESGTCTSVPEVGGGGVSNFANFGCGGQCNADSTVLALQSIYFHLSPIMLSQEWSNKYNATISEYETQEALTRFKKQLMVDVYGTVKPNGDKLNGLKIASFVNDAFAWTIESASAGSAPLGLFGMVLLVVYAVVAFHRVPLKKSRYLLGIFGVLSVFMGIGSGLGVASLIGIKFNTTSIQVLQFLMAGLGVDDMFILAASFYTFDDSVVDDHDIAGNCLAKIGPSITLTSITNIIAFSFGTLTPLPITVAFTQMCAICVLFIYLNVVFVFTAVCAKHAHMKRVDRSVLEKFTDELNNGMNWFARVYASITTSIGGASFIIVIVAVFFYTIYENGYTKLVQGLSFEHLFDAGSKEADFWFIQDTYFGFMPFSIVTENVDFARQGPLLYHMQRAVEADECQGDTCLCSGSSDPMACPNFHGNNAVHPERTADGLDIGIRLPFPTEREADCSAAFVAWSSCVGSKYVYRTGGETDDNMYGDDLQPLLDSERLGDLAKANDETIESDLCKTERDDTFVACGDWNIGYDKTLAIEEGLKPSGEAKKFYEAHPNLAPHFEMKCEEDAKGCIEPPQSWIQPYENLVEKFGITWLHIMLQWALPCWYGLFYGPGDVLGEAGFPVPRNIREIKDYCTQAFGSEDAYALRCQDGFFGEETDEFSNGKCGANYGFTWSDEHHTLPCCTVDAEVDADNAAEAGCTVNAEARHCRDCKFAGSFTVYNHTKQDWDVGENQLTHMFMNHELSASLEMLKDYVFEPMDFEITYAVDKHSGANPNKILSVFSPLLDTHTQHVRAGSPDGTWDGSQENDAVSGNFTFAPLASLFFPHASPTEYDIFKDHMWGENEGFPCEEHVDANGVVSHWPCVNQTSAEVFLSVCTAMPMYWFTCAAEDGIGWRGTGREPCWQGQEWVDIFNAGSTVYQLAIHPEHFDRCLEEMVNIDDRWKVIGPKFACECTMEDETTGALPPGTCKADKSKVTESNPNGRFTDCSLFDRGNRKLILPVTYTEITMIANGLDDTEKYVELIKWTRDVTTRFTDRYDFKVFPTGLPIVFWEQYVSLWDTVISSLVVSSGVVWFVMFVAFLFIQPESVKGARLYLCAAWTSVILVFNLILITFALLCLMGISDIWLNGIPAMTLIASVGVAVEFTSHLTFAYLQVEGSSRERAMTAVEHMFKPMLDGAFSTAISFLPLALTQFIFVRKYFFLLYMVLTAGGLVVGLILLPAMLALVGMDAKPDPNASVVRNARRFSVSDQPIVGAPSRKSIMKIMSRKDLHPDILQQLGSPNAGAKMTTVVPVSS